MLFTFDVEWKDKWFFLCCLPYNNGPSMNCGTVMHND